MKTFRKFAAPIAFAFSTTLHASPIQIDFTGSIVSMFDNYGTIFTGNYGAQSITGQFIFDDGSIPAKTTTSDIFGDSISYTAPELDWLSGSISINGQTYLVGNNVSAVSYDNLFVNPPSWTNGSTYLQDMWLYQSQQGGVETFASSFLTIENKTLNSNVGTSIDDIESIASAFKMFSFGSTAYTYNHDQGSVNYTEQAWIQGNITSISISRPQPSTSVPEPSSISLLMVGALGLLISRLRSPS